MGGLSLLDAVGGGVASNAAVVPAPSAIVAPTNSSPRPFRPDFMAAAFNVRYRSVHSVATTFSGRMMPLLGQIRMATFIGSMINCSEYACGSGKQAGSSLASASNCFSA